MLLYEVNNNKYLQKVYKINLRLGNAFYSQFNVR